MGAEPRERGARPATDRWLAAADGLLPAREGPEDTADRLVLLLHYGIPWGSDTSWVAARRDRYWGVDGLLSNRVRAATYRAANLAEWWSAIAKEFQAQPRDADERAEVARLTGMPDERAVRHTLRWQAPLIALRAQIVADAFRDSRPARAGGLP